MRYTGDMAKQALIFLALALPSLALAAPAVKITPETPLQGEPVMIEIATPNPLAAATFNGEPLRTIPYGGGRRIFIGIDLGKKPGDYPLRFVFPGGETVERTITVMAREKIEAPLGIPEKLGGNTPQSQAALVAMLAQENSVLSSMKTGSRAFWSEPFLFPLRTEIVITDPYGYTRQTGAYSIAHKGTDFRAEEGTRVRAMNRGVVRLARAFRNYGKTVVVDHGLGIQTFYMHLSRINVSPGELVVPGQILGLSGQTGYAESPHLHITVRIGGTSIDPIKFLALLGTTPS